MNPNVNLLSLYQSGSPLQQLVLQGTEVLFQNAILNPELRRRIQPSQSVMKLLDEVLQDKQFDQAITVLAYALAPREGLLWCILCIEELAGQTLSALERWQLENCVRWIFYLKDIFRFPAGQSDPTLAASPIDCVSQAIRDHGAYVESVLRNGRTTGKPNPSGLPQLMIMCIHRILNCKDPNELERRRNCAIALGIGMLRGLFQFAKHVD